MPTTSESAKESLRAVLRNPDLRRAQLAFAGSTAGAARTAAEDNVFRRLGV